MREPDIAFSMSRLYRDRPEKVDERAVRVDHALPQIVRFSFTNVTHEIVDERCIAVDSREPPPKVGRHLLLDAPISPTRRAG
jgi:hypothetical protein